MLLSKRYTGMVILVAATMMVILARSMGYRSLSEQGVSGSHFVDTGVAPPYSAAVVYLLSIMPGPRLPDQIFQSLALMQMNIPWRHQWPVLLLHAGAYDTPESQADFMRRLRDSAGDNGMDSETTEMLAKRIEFHPTYHPLPEGIPADLDDREPVWEQEWPAYHHMCAFYSYKIFDHPRIRDFTYYLRLDDDSYVLEPACFDPFQYMHVHNKSYAFRRESPDMGWVTEGMWPFVSNYAQRHPDVERRLQRNSWEWPPNRLWGSNFGEGENFPSYETNFDLVKVPRFRTPEMTEFLSELASDPKRFYWHRWGDAPVRLAEVYMFLDVPQEVHHMCEIRYAHKDKFENDCECVPLLE